MLTAMKATRKSRAPRAPGQRFLKGQLLLAMPAMADRRFARSVIYMCAHSSSGAMGLIINQRARNVSFPDLIEQFEIRGIRRRLDASTLARRQVHIGGPVETARGFVLHSSDYSGDSSTMRIGGGVSLTVTVDILRAIVNGDGPDRSILALGYANWGPGQLEREIRSNGWLHCPADVDLVFDPALEGKYERAMSRIGIDTGFLVNDYGHA
ncbi:MAG: YqgE/AlgH family protein [Hyphomicrobiales bacterium]|nr:YqgE/AlgH family protein [Hyphomicrobiales bacterium]